MMAFWNQNKLPAEYRNMSEDQISALLTAGKAAETDKTKLQSDLDAANAAKTKAEGDLTAANTKLTETSKWVEKVKKEGLVVEPENGGNQPQGPPSDAEWLTDPTGSFQRSVASTTAVALHGSMMAARLLADQHIQGQGPVEKRLWNKYIKEVEALVNALPPDQRILPQTWINQFIYVKGLHINDVVKEAQGQGEAFFSETAVSTGKGMPEGHQADNDTLTEQEKAIAKKMGRTPEQYLAQKKKMQFGPALS